jgi:nitroreductase
MNLEQAIYQRRSVRKYLPDPVPESAVQKLMEYAMAAPSACNKKPWEFYVVTDPDILGKLKHTHMFTNYNSPMIIIVAGNPKKALPGKQKEFWIQDCTAALENLLLGALELGLGTCWCGLYPNERAADSVREVIGAEEHIVPMALLHVGYPAEHPAPRTQFDEKKVHYLK